MTIPKTMFQKAVLFILCLPNFILFGQKHFCLTVRLPKELKKENVEVYLDNGKLIKKISSQPTVKNELLLTGEYYSLYATIEIQYQEGAGTMTKVFHNSFYVQQKPALITFYKPNSYISSLDSYSLKNAIDFKDEKKEMANFDSAERRKAREYEIKYGDKVFLGTDTALSNYYFKVLRKAQGRKKLEYILKNSNSYYSFYSFRTDVARPLILPPDSLLLIFNNIFPDKFKYSDEGNFLNNYLNGIISTQKEGSSIDFTAKDINGKVVTLSDFKDKKIVLLHFWATWCSPCMLEIPVLKNISKQYDKKDLQIISIALKSTQYATFIKTIKNKQMDWIHIYNDGDLYNKYGNSPIPRICLIDKTGRSIYDNFGPNKGDDSQLSQLRKILDSTINKQ